MLFTAYIWYTIIKRSLREGSVPYKFPSYLKKKKKKCLICLDFPILQTGKKVGKVLHASLQKILDKEESLGTTRPKVGFLG